MAVFFSIPNLYCHSRVNKYEVFELNPNQEITTYLKKFEREQSHIEDRRYEIHLEIDKLEREDTNLVDRFNKLESMKDGFGPAPHYYSIQLRRNRIFLKKIRFSDFFRSGAGLCNWSHVIMFSVTGKSDEIEVLE